jgi:hypothetical protein
VIAVWVVLGWLTLGRFYAPRALLLLYAGREAGSETANGPRRGVTPVDDVFRALGDANRRELLDRLFRRNGQTLVELSHQSIGSKAPGFLATMAHCGCRMYCV